MYSVNHLTHFRIRAQDGDIGHVHDFFCDKSWKIRYLVAEIWYPAIRVLISPSAVENIDEKEKKVYIARTMEEIQHSPDIETQKLSSQQIEEYDDHAGLIYYWTGHDFEDERKEVVDPESERHKYLPEHDPDESQEISGTKNTPPRLRSLREAMHFGIQAVDGRSGYVEDFLVSKRTRIVTYIVINTRKWFLGEKVLLTPDHIQKIRWHEKEIYMDVTEKGILEAPQYDPENPPDSKK